MINFKNALDLLNQYNCTPYNYEISVSKIDWAHKTSYTIYINHFNAQSCIKITDWYFNVEHVKVKIPQDDNKYQIVSQTGKQEISQVEYMQLALKCQEILSDTEKTTFKVFHIDL